MKEGRKAWLGQTGWVGRREGGKGGREEREEGKENWKEGRRAGGNVREK